MFTKLQSEIKTNLGTNPKDFTALRELLKSAAKHRYIVLPRFNLTRNADKAAMLEIAQKFLSQKLVTKTTLKSRGWTEGLITKHIGKPDLLMENPNYKSAAPMCLYSLDRIEALELMPTVAKRFESLEKHKDARRAGAAKAVETKVAKLEAWVNSLVAYVPLFSIPTLVKDACWHYNDLWESRSRHGYSDKKASINDDASFLERICCNYLRHACTSYEDKLREMAGKTGCVEVYQTLKDKINKAIDETYPNLYEEIVNYQINYKEIESDIALKKKQEQDSRKAEKLARWNEHPDQALTELSRNLEDCLRKNPTSSKKKRNQQRNSETIIKQMNSYAEQLSYKISTTENPSVILREISEFLQLNKEKSHQ